MPNYSFRAFEVDGDYYNGEDGLILGETTLDVSDDDSILQQWNGSDPGDDQMFSIGGAGFSTDYYVDFQDFAVVNNSGPEFEVFAFRTGDGASERYFVFSKDAGFLPSAGNQLTVARYNVFTETDYGDIESSICFAKGTMIRTPKGEVAIQELKVGDIVETLDRGPQPVQWIGSRWVSAASMRDFEGLKPIVIKQGACGNDRPLVVSQQHAIALQSLPMSEGVLPDCLVRAKHLAQHFGGLARVAHGTREVSYYHILLPNHDLLWANGVLAETLRLGPQACAILGPATLGTIDAAVHQGRPEQTADVTPPIVRPVVTRKRAKALGEQWRAVRRKGLAARSKDICAA